jgi:hypothetical protein
MSTGVENVINSVSQNFNLTNPVAFIPIKYIVFDNWIKSNYYLDMGIIKNDYNSKKWVTKLKYF